MLRQIYSKCHLLLYLPPRPSPTQSTVIVIARGLSNNHQHHHHLKHLLYHLLPSHPLKPTPPLPSSHPRTLTRTHSTTTTPHTKPPKMSSSKPPQTQQEITAEFEAQIKRNPHPDFKKVEASRPPWSTTTPSLRTTQTASPTWTFGSGANHLPGSDPSSQKRHIPIDPYAPLRPSSLNYKLLISAITPRPIALLSTRSPSGESTNLAPFSYFNVISHDPPLFVIGFVGAASEAVCKDSLRNLLETKECVINIVSEHFIEAANATSINAPYGVSEWDVSGLTPVYDCQTVGCARVRESMFSIEGRLESSREFESRSVPGKMGSTMVVIEGTRFWAREDVVDGEGSVLDLEVLRPVARLGGITYSRQVEALEIPRQDFKRDLGGEEGLVKLEKKDLPN